MNIKGPGLSLYSEMQAMAQQARMPTHAMPLKPMESSEVQVINSSQTDFSSMLKGAIDNVNSLQGEARTLRNHVELGTGGVTIAEAMIAASKSSIAFDATMQVRNKVVEAYKEIMTMPV
ncbi:flagellar hook-basal body complex protein FliE [Alkalimonas collagenimarina]|uniref:Flagellar hook-basal body complex protein FliE n=1 Tax=Alkalimonas collagenimarina TaxID=400390 RepID=A0ABT9H2J9_9GAMM|nr:flagellar hook-basal body complex protein FliE [Alkalimonas collagenimarina]MDP4537536.1 flagellar hook-basal body complex protein FliE [Alkalimonas collagenimarina]